MVTVKEVPADVLIKRLSEYLRENIRELRPPSWVNIVKLGVHKEEGPEDLNWWYVRAASILRKLAVSSEPIGVSTLSIIYGGLKRRGSAPPHFRRAARNNLRKLLQQLERAGLVSRTPRGRVLTPKGQSLVSSIAFEVFTELARERPDLSKYGS
ncbi:MAG: 30S ribosomal protein S19e [Sulfolobales archaeon]|nr:30S ribosomal protein S19e [Sulfolobales archaeon]MDW8082287.1 30S ribosomal protein S19e [Sulfolobales archaeon]